MIFKILITNIFALLSASKVVYTYKPHAYRLFFLEIIKKQIAQNELSTSVFLRHVNLTQDHVVVISKLHYMKICPVSPHTL